MKRASYDVRESDPFAPEQTFRALPAAVSPIVGRVEAMWETMRGVVIENFPKAHGLPKDRKEFSVSSTIFTRAMLTTRCRSRDTA